MGEDNSSMGPIEIVEAFFKALELLMIGFIILFILSAYIANREMSFVSSQMTLMAKEMVDQADKNGGFTTSDYARIQDEYLSRRIKTWVKPSDITIEYMSPAMGTKRTYLGQPVTIKLTIQARKTGFGWIKRDLKVQASSVNRGNYGDGYYFNS